MPASPSSHASWAHGVAAAGRRERAAAACNFAVHGVAKSGKPYKQEMSVHATRDEADQKAEYYASVNPGRSFVVVGR